MNLTVLAALPLGLLLSPQPSAAAPVEPPPACSKPSPSTGRWTVLVSDTHFGLGKDCKDGKDHRGNPCKEVKERPWHPFEDFRWEKDFKNFLAGIDEMGQGATDLVFNGDTFELWQSFTEDCKDTNESYGCTEVEALDRLRRVLSEHDAEMKAIGEFAARAGNRVILVPGNHDAALLFPRLAKEVFDAIAAPAGRACIPPEGYWLSWGGQIFAEHGHQIGHDVNSFEKHWPTPFTQTSPVHLVRTWGEQFVQSYYDKYELQYEAIDNMNDDGAGVSYGLAAEGKARAAVGVAKFIKFLLLDQSWPQFVSLLDEKKEPAWDVDCLRKQGDRFLVESIPRGEMRAAAEQALAAGELGLSVNQLSNDEIQEICNRRGALHKAYEKEIEQGLQAPVDTCSKCQLGALGERFLVSRNKVLGKHLETTVDGLDAKNLLVEGKPFSVFVYSHTHHAEEGFQPLSGTWNPVVANTGAWQRLMDRDLLEKIRKKKGWKDKELLDKLTLANFPACYSFILIKPYKDKEAPLPLLRYWTELTPGTWAIGTSCPPPVL